MRDLLVDVSSRFLTVRYIAALALVACLLLLSQLLVQHMLHRQAGDAAVINLAGRQRMLCERLTKAALAWRMAGDDQVREARAGEVAQVRAEWTAANQHLSLGQGLPGVGAGNSRAVADALGALQADFSAMVSASLALGEDPGSARPPARP